MDQWWCIPKDPLVCVWLESGVQRAILWPEDVDCQQHKLPITPLHHWSYTNQELFPYNIEVEQWKTLKSDKGHQKDKESVLAAIIRRWLSHPFEQKNIKFIRSSPSFEVAIGELFQFDPPLSDHVFKILQSLFLQRLCQTIQHESLCLSLWWRKFPLSKTVNPWS